MAFGSAIKKLREDAGISAEKIAARIGVSAARWRKWEEKDFDPREEDRALIEEFFGASIAEIAEMSTIKNFLKVPKKGHTVGNAEQRQPSTQDILAVLAGAFDKQADALKLQAEMMRNIEKNMARREDQAKIASSLKSLQDRIQAISSRQKGTGDIVLQSLERLEKKKKDDLVRQADNLILEIDKEAQMRDKSAVQGKRSMEIP